MRAQAEIASSASPGKSLALATTAPWNGQPNHGISAVFNAPSFPMRMSLRSEAVRATPGRGSPVAGWQRDKSITMGEPEPPEQVAEQARSGVAEQSRQMFATHCTVEFPPVPPRPRHG